MFWFKNVFFGRTTRIATERRWSYVSKCSAVEEGFWDRGFGNGWLFGRMRGEVGEAGRHCQEFDATRASCEGQAYSQLPPMMEQVQISAGYVTPIQTQRNRIGYSVNCYTTGGQYVSPVFMPIDRNQSGRKSLGRSCLYGAGWRPVERR